MCDYGRWDHMDEPSPHQRVVKGGNPHPLRTCHAQHITALEGQLDAALEALEEAQGKLKAVEEWYAELKGWGPWLLPGLDRILSKEGK